MLEHGGRLYQAAERYGIPLQDWLDLSTGINPQAWPVRMLSVDAWSRLPEVEDGLQKAALNYYRAPACLPVAGSQAAIQALPLVQKKIFPRAADRRRVGIPFPAYAEHAHAWQKAGFEVLALDENRIEAQMDRLDVLLIVNPNNPTGKLFSPQQLLQWHQSLLARNGCLIVDEAFMDSTPQHSLAGDSDRPGLIVLRSLGKFFGLAGARVGFVLAEDRLLQALAEQLGPWTISGPAREVARAALQDMNWQEKTRQQLSQAGKRLHDLLGRYNLPAHGGTPLFQWLQNDSAEVIHQALARQGILTRLFSQPASLRLGLPGSEQQWLRLEQALQTLAISAPRHKDARP